MSWSRQVKIYYAVAFMMLVSIVFSSIVAVTMKTPMSMEIFVVMILVQIIIQYFQQKKFNQYFTVLLPSALALVYELIRYPTATAIVFTVFIVVVNLYFCKRYEEAIYYESDKKTLINGLCILFMLSLFLIIMNPKIMPNMYRYLLIYIIISIIALREALGYFCGIQRKQKEKRLNFSLILASVALTINPIFEFFVFLGGYVWRGVLFLIYKIIDGIFYIVYNPMGWLIGKFFNWADKLIEGRPEDLELKIDTQLQATEEKTAEISRINPYIVNIIAKIVTVVVITIIIIIIVKIIKKINTKEGIKIKEEDFEETVESINESVEEKSLFKEIFRKRGTPKEEVIYMYGKLISISQKKGIFKSYMTPKQLKNEIKVKVDNVEEIDSITDIYNKARFSTHEVVTAEEEKVTKIVNIITKKLN